MSLPAPVVDLCSAHDEDDDESVRLAVRLQREEGFVAAKKPKRCDGDEESLRLAIRLQQKEAIAANKRKHFEKFVLPAIRKEDDNDEETDDDSDEETDDDGDEEAEKGPVVWHYWLDVGMDGLRRGWHAYDKKACQRLEGFIQNRGEKLSRTTWHLKSWYFSYEVDISNMTQRNMSSGTVRPIRRVLPGEVKSMTEPPIYAPPKKPKEEEGSTRKRKHCDDYEESLRLAMRLQQEEVFAFHGVPATKEQVLDTLKPCQRAAVEHVKNIARPAHLAALPRLVERVKKLGKTQVDLDHCLEYIRNEAPIIIHLKADTLAQLIKDTHYKNLFETKTSGGTNCTSSRESWERNLFGTSYDSCQGNLRPKYGCLNITGDIAGVTPARSYGQLFLILSPHVRYRATFSGRDTAGLRDRDLATNEYYAHILEQYADPDLEAALTVSRVGGSPSKCSTYKEVQIHGPVRLATDIQALSVPGHEASASAELIKTVTTFQKKTKCNVLWQSDLLGL